jgi:AbrB family looped-hinge helix DNA binding protein
MSTFTITAKGQVTLPKDILKHLGVQPGDRVAVDKLPGGRIEIKSGAYGQDFGRFRFFEKEGRPLAVD